MLLQKSYCVIKAQAAYEQSKWKCGEGTECTTKVMIDYKDHQRTRTSVWTWWCDVKSQSNGHRKPTVSSSHFFYAPALESKSKLLWCDKNPHWFQIIISLRHTHKTEILFFNTKSSSLHCRTKKRGNIPEDCTHIYTYQLSTYTPAVAPGKQTRQGNNDGSKRKLSANSPEPISGLIAPNNISFR